MRYNRGPDAVDIVENLLLLIAVAFIIWVTQAQGQKPPPISPEQWTEEAQLTLAQLLVDEADFSEPDHAAIAWVMVQRWVAIGQTETFTNFLKRYSATFRTSSARSKAIRTLAWGEASDHPWGGARWLKVQSFVRAWGRGEIRNPCPTAVHFGGPMDLPGKNFTVVGCGRTRNLFYRETSP